MTKTATAAEIATLSSEYVAQLQAFQAAWKAQYKAVAEAARALRQAAGSHTGDEGEELVDGIEVFTSERLKEELRCPDLRDHIAAAKQNAETAKEILEG